MVEGVLVEGGEKTAFIKPHRALDWGSADCWSANRVSANGAADNAADTHVRRFVLEGERVIAAVNLNNMVRGFFHSAYLGFSIDHQQQGQGKMHEALVAVIAHAFSPHRSQSPTAQRPQRRSARALAGWSNIARSRRTGVRAGRSCRDRPRGVRSAPEPAR